MLHQICYGNLAGKTFVLVNEPLVLVNFLICLCNPFDFLLSLLKINKCRRHTIRNRLYQDIEIDLILEIVLSTSRNVKNRTQIVVNVSSGMKRFY